MTVRRKKDDRKGQRGREREKRMRGKGIKELERRGKNGKAKNIMP